MPASRHAANVRKQTYEMHHAAAAFLRSGERPVLPFEKRRATPSLVRLSAMVRVGAENPRQNQKVR
jgi:hypothetical protein